MVDSAVVPPTGGRVLALDLGSSSVRAAVLAGPGLDPVPPGPARRPVRLVQRADGAAELDPAEYLAAVAAAVDELAGRGDLAGVTAAGMSTQWHSLVGIDRRGDPVGPGLSWLDTRPVLTGPGPDDPAGYHARTGTWWHPLYWPARLRWLAAAGARAHRWQGLPEYLTERLLGEAGASVSAASGTGALDTVHCGWDAEALALAGVPEPAVPPLLPPGWTGRLLPAYARRWPDLATAAWAEPVGDGAASAIGSGCLGPERLSVTIGTSAAVRLVAPGSPMPGPRVWRYRVDRAHSVLGVAYSGGGNLHTWLAALLVPQGVDEPALAALAPGEHGLVALPDQAGHRPPREPRGAGGAVLGLRLSTRAVDVAAAVLEGLCHEVADGARAVDPTGRGVPVLSGGAVRASPWLARRLAAALPPGAVRAQTPEIALRGAAMLATGWYPAPGLEPVPVTEAERAAMAAAGERHRAARNALS